MEVSAGRWTLRPKDELWPAALSQLGDAAPQLNGIGCPEVLSGPCISIIGARRATPYGLAIARMAGRVSAECGITVVSGGAMGCDHAAAEAALRAGGRTVVVSGCGADCVYPQSSEDIFRWAVEQGGAVVSLEPWGQTPRRWAFPRRNAIIAALSEVLIVTEAGARSGTMGTAEAAEELGRTVYAIPGSIFSPNSSGTNRLLSEGARVIPDEASLQVSIALDYGAARFSEQSPDRSKSPVMAALCASPSRPDELAIQLNEDVLTLLKTLTDFEARGLVVRLPDGRYSPSQAYLMAGDG